MRTMNGVRMLVLVSASVAAGRAGAGVVGTEVAQVAAPSFNLQPRPTQISVCFYGDALTARADRVQEITDALRRAEAVANLRFTGFGACGAPSSGTCGTGAAAHACDQYPEDIRIALDGTTAGGQAVTRQMPGSFLDCADLGAWSSWSHFPEFVDRPDRRACPYNAAVGDDADTSVSPPVRWLNHPLHEVGGHAMGFAHEFLQDDYHDLVGPNGSVCASSTGPAPAGYVGLTQADSLSVMMYQDLSCGIPGNYGHGGYSSRDKLSLHILYPEPARVAEYVGTTVVKTNQPVTLQASWFVRGARPSVAQDLAWSVGGVSRSGATFQAAWPTAGSRTGAFGYRDFLGRSYAATVEIRVLEPREYDGRIAAPIAAHFGSL